MSYAKLFKKAGVEEYDLYTLRATVNEVQLRGFDIEIVRGPVESIGYTCRALSRKGKLTGQGRSSCSNSAKLKECIEAARYLSGLNLLETKYEFPSAKKRQKCKNCRQTNSQRRCRSSTNLRKTADSSSQNWNKIKAICQAHFRQDTHIRFGHCA